MKNLKGSVSVFTLIMLSSICLSAQTQLQPNRRQVSDILRRLTQSTDIFRNSVTNSVNRGRTGNMRAEDNSTTILNDFDAATNRLRTRFNSRRSVGSEVQNVLQKASAVNDFMTRTRVGRTAQDNWDSVKSDLNSLATAYGVTWQLSQQSFPTISTNRQNRLTDQELNQLIGRIENGGNTFRSSLSDAFDHSAYNQTIRRANINESLLSFKSAMDQLRSNFDAGRSLQGDVARVMAKATVIDQFMHNNQITDRAQNDWSTLRTDLNTLSNAYNISSNFDNSSPGQVSSQTGINTYGTSNRLTGTFRLDPSLSDNPREVAERARGNLSNNDRQASYDRMLARLESPKMLAIDRRGTTVTISSSRAPQTTFVADGLEHQEQISNGRSTRVIATLNGDQLVVSSSGYRENDFNVTFDSIENGRRLRVRRQIFPDGGSQAVVADSVYDRTSDSAEWNVYNGATPILGTTSSANSEFIVRDGETIIAQLNNDLTTKQAKEGDRFTMTVRQPSQYDGAVIEGTVGSVTQSGRLSGRSGITLNFDTIRLSNGQTYRFSGIIGNVRTVNGDTVKVDNEGNAQGDNQTTQTIQRAGIGTAIGAIIGAIAGGGKGAAIGGIIGAAGGAGTVYVQGKDDLELPSGTEVTIRASAPTR
jgi:hypothetical protein